MGSFPLVRCPGFGGSPTQISIKLIKIVEIFPRWVRRDNRSPCAPNVVWAELDGLDFAPGAPTLATDPRDPALSGSIVAGFAPA